MMAKDNTDYFHLPNIMIPRSNGNRKRRKARQRCRILHDSFTSKTCHAIVMLLLTQCCHHDIMVQATSHGHVPYNNYARAASLASQHAANQERQSRQQRSTRPSSKPKRKKTIEEGIQAAKRFPKVDVDEVDSDVSDVECFPNDEALLSDLSEDDSSIAIDGDEGLSGISSGFEPEPKAREHADEHSSRRKKRRKKRKTRRSKDVDEPSSSPSMAPTAMPTSDNAIDESVATIATDPQPPSLVGMTLLDKFYITNQVRVGSTKSELYQCYHVSDIETKRYPLMIKLAQNVGQMQLEHKIYSELYSKLTPEQMNLFIKVFDWIPASDLTGNRVGFVMEAGLENLRGIIWRHGPMSGDTLQQAMKSVIQTIRVLHELGTIWTEVKAENFVVMPDGSIKAIDLESVAARGEFLRCYSAETYPPEFPPDSLYNEIPQLPLDYSFDIWGLGLILLEMAIGEPLFTLQRTYDVDYVRERLKDAKGIVDEARQRLENVDPQAREVILQCLVVDAAQRSNCEQLLNHKYFQT